MQSVKSVFSKYSTDSDDDETMFVQPTKKPLIVKPRRPQAKSIEQPRRTSCSTLMCMSILGAGSMFTVFIVVHACVSHVSTLLLS